MFQKRKAHLKLIRRAYLTGSHGAKDGIRTRDPNLGKVVLYQLSYFRIGIIYTISNIECFKSEGKHLQLFTLVKDLLLSALF